MLLMAILSLHGSVQTYLETVEFAADGDLVAARLGAEVQLVYVRSQPVAALRVSVAVGLMAGDKRLVPSYPLLQTTTSGNLSHRQPITVEYVGMCGAVINLTICVTYASSVHQ